MAEAIKWVPEEGNADVQKGFVEGATNPAFVLTKTGTTFSLANNITDRSAGKISPLNYGSETDAKAGAEKLLEQYSIPTKPTIGGVPVEEDQDGDEGDGE